MFIKLNQEFEKESNSSWIEAFPFGSYKHWLYGKFEMNESKASEAVKNFNDKVATRDIHIDYNHLDGPAAGWVKSLEAKDNSIYAEVEWTDKAKSEIEQGLYKYFSPTYGTKWKNPITREKHDNVFLGGALTNNPFLRNINKVELQEDHMSMELVEEIRGLLNLSEEDNLLDAIKKLAEQPEPVAPEPIKAEDDPKDSLIESLKAAGLDDAVKQLQEQNEQIQKLMLANKLSEAASKVSNWSTAKNSLPAAVGEKVRDLLVKSPMELHDSIVEVFDELVKLGTISSEIGSVDPNANKIVTFADMVDKYVVENKVDYMTALEVVAGQHPDLYEQHRQNDFVG